MVWCSKNDSFVFKMVLALCFMCVHASFLVGTQVEGNLELNEYADIPPMDEFFNDGHHSDIVVSLQINCLWFLAKLCVS